MICKGVRIGLLALTLLTGAEAAPSASAAAHPRAADSGATDSGVTDSATTGPRSPGPATVEEQRLGLAAPQEILRRSGFDSVAPEFARALERTASYARAERLVAQQGARLWRRAVDRAQGRGPARGDLSRDDDRPLYWARLGMTREVRRWEPPFGLSDARRTRLLDTLERTSRGQEDVRRPRAEG